MNRRCIEPRKATLHPIIRSSGVRQAFIKMTRPCCPLPSAYGCSAASPWSSLSMSEPTGARSSHVLAQERLHARVGDVAKTRSGSVASRRFQCWALNHSQVSRSPRPLCDTARNPNLQAGSSTWPLLVTNTILQACHTVCASPYSSFVPIQPPVTWTIPER